MEEDIKILFFYHKHTEINMNNIKTYLIYRMFLNVKKNLALRDLYIKRVSLIYIRNFKTY